MTEKIANKEENKVSRRNFLKGGAILGASVELDFAIGSAGGNPNSPLYTWDAKPVDHKYEFGSIEDATKVIKKAAKFYGADLVGITPYDEKWVYDPMWQFAAPDGIPKDLTDKDFPFNPKSVIVMAFEMDYESFATSPSQISDAAAMLIYSKMAETNYKLARFIR